LRSVLTGSPNATISCLIRTRPIAPAGGVIADPGSQRGATVTKVDRYIRECLQPFIDRRIVSHIDVKAERVGRERIDAHIIAYRGPTLAIEMRYAVLWEQMLIEAE
jgi:hypothetical protein